MAINIQNLVEAWLINPGVANWGCRHDGDQEIRLCSSLWKSADELRGGMDASQYKDYVLVLLFVKYVSDKYAWPEERQVNFAGRFMAGRGNVRYRSLADIAAMMGLVD